MKPIMQEIDDRHWKITFEESGAKGVVDLYAGAYGLDIRVNGMQLGLVDLFSASPSGYTENNPYPQFVVDDGDTGNDVLAFVKLFPGGTVVKINEDAEEIDERAFGYTSNPAEKE
jgi:hypothetical protein